MTLWMAALTADHGVLPLPEHLQTLGVDARRIDEVGEITELLRAHPLDEALARVRAELGPDALILNTRTLAGGRGRFGLFGRPRVEVQAASNGIQSQDPDFGGGWADATKRRSGPKHKWKGFKRRSMAARLEEAKATSAALQARLKAPKPTRKSLPAPPSAAGLGWVGTENVPPPARSWRSHSRTRPPSSPTRSARHHSS